MVYIVGFQYVEETINVCLSCRIFDFFFALRGGPKDVHEVLVLLPGHVFFSLEVVWSNI